MICKKLYFHISSQSYIYDNLVGEITAAISRLSLSKVPLLNFPFSLSEDQFPVTYRSKVVVRYVEG